MSQQFEIDKAQSQCSGTVGRSKTTAHGVAITLDASKRPQPDGITNSEAFLGSVSSCGVTMIEMRAQETGVPLKRTRVTIEGSRDPAIPRYLTVQMRFELAGVSKEQAQELLEFYRGHCPLYGTLAVAAKVSIDFDVVPA